ncbi:unnamed protein product [Rotaria socialis]|uniref:Uncharacterized protein n=1 Tax=Rotaria socialis TaxID=392032 RepID=A0A820LHE5_9BILA|nr:unnamed protein product [Rotaria socialis]
MIRQKTSCLILCVWLLSILSIHAQIDRQLCPNGAITIRDPKWPNISPSFELFAELTSKGGTSEIIQTLGNQRDAIIQTSNGEIIFEYWYFDTNERLTILNGDTNEQSQSVCLRQEIDPLTVTSTIESAVFVKPSVLLGYDARDMNNPNFGAKFIGPSQLKFMPVNIFESCFYLNDSRETVAVTYYMSDIEKYPTFGYLNDSIPLRIEVRTKSAANGNEGTYFYNIFRFLSNLTVEREQHALSLPAGVVCSNQTNTKSIPGNFSEHISINGEVLLSFGNKLAVESFDTIYDQSLQFARFKSLLSNGEQTIELHDFATGLVYHYLTSTRQCQVWKINSTISDAAPIPGQSQIFQMAKPLHLFLLDDMNFQYVGSRKCHNRMLCHVWIGENLLPDQSEFEQREWYWAYQFNGQNIEPWIPTRLVSTRFDAQHKQTSLMETNLYNYRSDPFSLVAIDNTIADCYRALGPTEKFHYGIFTFVINNQDEKPVQSYSHYLKLIIWDTLADHLKIRPIRLSNVVIDQNKTDLIVTFTLVDNPPLYGPVANPLQEPSLDAVVKNLRTLIDTNNISFVVVYDNTEGVRLYPKPGSLNVIARTPTIIIINNITEIVFEIVTNTTKVTTLISKERNRGSKITALWIGFTILGLCIGLVGTFFIGRQEHFINWKTYAMISSQHMRQDTEWNGDKNICIPDVTPSSPSKSLPTLPSQAQFIMETVSSVRISDTTGYPTVNIIQYFYDYYANMMMLQKNQLGFVEHEYYYYDQLKKMTYFPQKYCVVTDIPTKIDSDSGSAVQLSNGTYHIRQLSELLQFFNPSIQKPLVPKYMGPGTFRDIDVDQWELCIVDQTTKRTEHRVWYFIQPEFQTSVGTIPNISIPLGYAMNTSIVPNDGSQNLEFNEITSIYSFKPTIMETSDFFAPPRGTFCPNLVPELVSLSDLGIEWPLRYTIRIDATTSRGIRANPLHLTVDNNPDTKRARFDYLIDNENNYETVVIDYREQIKYVIDRTRGSCRIVQGVGWPDVNPESKPIEFFLKLKETMLDQPPINAWQYRGVRLCRGSKMHCTINTMVINDYPAIVDPETGFFNGQNWNETHIEYEWSKRDPVMNLPAGEQKSFDYPVSLFLRTHQITETSTGTKYRFEEVEYEFYGMTTDISNDAFDVSDCYRSRDWPYLHLGFTLNLNRGNLVDSNHLDRKALYDSFLITLQTAMRPISVTRIHQLEIDHDVTSTSNTIYVMFILLGPVPIADPISNNETSKTTKSTDQFSVETAREKLRTTINNGDFNINVQLFDDDRSNITFRAVPDSLQNAREFLASHPLIFNLANHTVSEINVINMTNTIVQTLVVFEQKINLKWSSKAQTVGIVVGLLIGLVLGIIIVVAAKFVRKPLSSSSSTMISMAPITNLAYDRRQETLITDSNTSTA